MATDKASYFAEASEGQVPCPYISQSHHATTMSFHSPQKHLYMYLISYIFCYHNNQRKGWKFAFQILKKIIYDK